MTARLAIIIFCLGVPIALLLPAVQAAREAARRTNCVCNHKGITLALHNYHDTHQMFPMGVEIAGGLPTASAGGWISGTEDAVTPVGPAANITDHSSEPGDWVARSLFNITTVRYPLNLKRVMKGPGAGYPGCGQVMGHSNPLQSPHPGGMVAGSVDGWIRFIADTTDFGVLLRLVIRDDGQAVKYE